MPAQPSMPDSAPPMPAQTSMPGAMPPPATPATPSGYETGPGTATPSGIDPYPGLQAPQPFGSRMTANMPGTEFDISDPAQLEQLRRSNSCAALTRPWRRSSSSSARGSREGTDDGL
jgi:hypothetical protein